MKKWPIYPRVLVALAAVATTLPIFGGYFVSFQLLCWLVVTGRWGPAGRRSVASVADAVSAADLARARAVLRPIHFGVAALVTAMLVSSLVSWATSPYVPSLSAVLKVDRHYALKLGLLWFVLAGALTWIWRLGWSPVRMGRWLALWLGVNFVYCLVQRSTGIDWTHGFDAVLGPHRQAYGVYRISGFMGHPLTLAYNLVMIALAASALLWREGASLRADDRRWWWGALALATLTLLASGSRFPLAVLIGTWLACEWRRLWRYRLWIAGAAVVAAAALWLEGSMIGRVRELFDPSIPLTSRFDRVVFWRTHWRIFLDYPLAGVGVSGLDTAYPHYYAGEAVRDNIYTAHNIFLQTLADSGLIGFLGLALFLAGLGRAAWRLGGARGSAYLLGGVVASGLMQNNLRDSEFLFALWLLLATSALAASRTADERESPQNLEPPTDRPHSAAHLSG